MKIKQTVNKEQTIFHHVGSTISTDREIDIVAKLEEPLIVVLGKILSDEECDELIRLSMDKMKHSKIGTTREENELRTSSSMFIEESENEIVARVENRIAAIMNIIWTISPVRIAADNPFFRHRGDRFVIAIRCGNIFGLKKKV